MLGSTPDFCGRIIPNLLCAVVFAIFTPSYEKTSSDKNGPATKGQDRASPTQQASLGEWQKINQSVRRTEPGTSCPQTENGRSCREIASLKAEKQSREVHDRPR